MNSLVKLATVTGFGLALAGCSNMNVFKDSPSAPPPSANIAAPAAPIAPAPMEKVAPKTNTLSAAQINKIFAGKTFNWAGDAFSGTTVFAQDGSSLLEVSGKGTTSGRWDAVDGSLCESINPGAVIQAGSKRKCREIVPLGGGKYKIGSATFTPA